MVGAYPPVWLPLAGTEDKNYGLRGNGFRGSFAKTSMRIGIACSYTGVPSDLNFLIFLPSLELLAEECFSVVSPSGSWRLRAPLAPNTTATRKAKIPAVTPYMNIASAMSLSSLSLKIKLSLLSHRSRWSGGIVIAASSCLLPVADIG